MKPATPRKSRRRNQPATTGPSADTVPASDYESDAYIPAAAAPAPETVAVFPDTAGDPNVRAMNLRVLRRNLPTTESFDIIANIASVYKWDNETVGWGELAFKGVLFLCHMQPDLSSTGYPVPRESLYLLNRLSLQDLEIDLASVIAISQQVVTEERMFTLETITASGSSVAWGLLLSDCGNLAAAWENIQRSWNAVKTPAS